MASLRISSMSAQNGRSNSNLQKKTGHSSYKIKPTYVVELHWPESTSAESSQFLSLSQKYGTFYAYHGSRVENFHSILRYGLISHLNKNSLFGTGTYLSTDLSVCMPYSPIGQGWLRSQLGHLMSCIAVCEVVNHPDLKSGKARVQRNEGGETVGDKVPDKYYIIGNNELLRVKYVLVFAENSRKRSGRQANRFLRAVGRHKFAAVIGVYVFLLVIIGFLQSSFYTRLSRRLFSY
eukprot:m.56257 g.56257  ORF g.56257 m.56257 type:complete len:235 (+) comp34580_c0_seq5:271-975(+)